MTTPKTKSNENDPSHTFKIRFYDCSTYKKRKEIETALVDAGAIMQDYRPNFKTSGKRHLDDTVEFSFTTDHIERFLKKLSKNSNDIWQLSDYAMKYFGTGSLAGSSNIDYKPIL